MTTIEFLEKQYNHAFDMVKFGETKNTTLIAFNGAIIVGMIKLVSDTSHDYLKYYLLFVVGMCCISIFVCLSALFAKINQADNKISLEKSDNLLFYATLAHMTPEGLIKKITTDYDCEKSNPNHESDVARQVIVTSQIAARKFKYFNIAMSFTISGLLTPVSYFTYKAYLDHD